MPNLVIILLWAGLETENIWFRLSVLIYSDFEFGYGYRYWFFPISVSDTGIDFFRFRFQKNRVYIIFGIFGYSMNYLHGTSF